MLIYLIFPLVKLLEEESDEINSFNLACFSVRRHLAELLADLVTESRPDAVRHSFSLDQVDQVGDSLLELIKLANRQHSVIVLDELDEVHTNLLEDRLPDEVVAEELEDDGDRRYFRTLRLLDLVACVSHHLLLLGVCGLHLF